MKLAFSSGRLWIYLAVITAITCLTVPRTTALSKKAVEPDLISGSTLSKDTAQSHSEIRQQGDISSQLMVSDAMELEKRSEETLFACKDMDHDQRRYGRYGEYEGRHSYRWTAAQCAAPFLGPYFWVWCHHTFRPAGSLESHFVDERKYSKICRQRNGPEYCVPDNKATSNGIGTVENVRDIECIPQNFFQRKPTIVEAKEWTDIKMCTIDIFVPREVAQAPAGPSGTKFVPNVGQTYLLAESIQLATGEPFNASKMYIEDATSKFFEPWRRGEVGKSDIATSVITIHTKQESRTVRFCVEVARGIAAHLVFKYGVFPLNDKTMRVHTNDTDDVKPLSVN